MKPNPYFIDNENPEWTTEDFKKAKRGYEFFTPEQLEGFSLMNEKARLEKSQEIKIIKIALEASVIDKFKATGKGWKARMNEALREHKIA